MADTDKEQDESIKEEKYELIDTEGIFSNMYEKDTKIQGRVQAVLASKELKKLKKKSDDMVSLLTFLDELRLEYRNLVAEERELRRLENTGADRNAIEKKRSGIIKKQDKILNRAKDLLESTRLTDEVLPRDDELLPLLERLKVLFGSQTPEPGQVGDETKTGNESANPLAVTDPVELNNRKLRAILRKSQTRVNYLDLLHDVVPRGQEPRFYQRFRISFKVFRDDPEYDSKEEYLNYLKRAYRFMMIPLEEQPSLIYRIFYRESGLGWVPSHDDAKELLEKFYLEKELIDQLPDRDWEKVKNAKEPEVTLNRLLYGIDFKPDFESFLKNIPWIVSRDRYGAPALDLVFWNPPGTEIPQKPVAVDDGFIDELIEGVKKHQSYARIEVNDKFVELKSRKQIEQRLEVDERVLIDSYVGVSKIERDFVLHKRLILWSNPGYERWVKESKMGKMKRTKPKPYLVMLQEKATQLEIPFVAQEDIARSKK